MRSDRPDAMAARSRLELQDILGSLQSIFGCPCQRHAETRTCQPSKRPLILVLHPWTMAWLHRCVPLVVLVQLWLPNEAAGPANSVRQTCRSTNRMARPPRPSQFPKRRHNQQTWMTCRRWSKLSFPRTAPFSLTPPPASVS